MYPSQTPLLVFVGLAVLALVGAETLSGNTPKSLYKLLQSSYGSELQDKRAGDLEGAYDSPPDLMNYNFGSFMRRPASGYKNLIEDKRFGYVGSRGKRMDHTTAFLTLRDLMDMYEQKARALPFRSAYRTMTSQADSGMMNNKRQPHFGFHGVRG